MSSISRTPTHRKLVDKTADHTAVTYEPPLLDLGERRPAFLEVVVEDRPVALGSRSKLTMETIPRRYSPPSS